jgi:hypothetical protein
MKKKTGAKPAAVKRAAAKPTAARKAAAKPAARQEHNVQRRHIRFKPDPMDHAEIAVRRPGLPFDPEMVALICEEAPMGGCGLILVETPLLQVGDICRVKVGRIDPLGAEVVWRKAVEPGIIRVGMKFLE